MDGNYGRSGRKRLMLRSALLAWASVASAGAANAGTLAARPASEVEEVIVTGQKDISPAPRKVRRANMAQVDSIGAKEIEKLADKTVADVVSRLPGVAVYRGFLTQKSWYVNIRGFDGAYNAVDLDGGMFFDSTRNNRAVYLDTVPASAINEIQVYKTVTPDMDAHAIGGHVSIKTLRAFDLGGQPITRGDFSVDKHRSEYTTRSSTPGYTGNAVVKRTFGSEANLGFVGAVSFHNDYLSENESNVTAYTQNAGITVPSSLIQHGDYDQHDYGYSLLGKLEARRDETFYAFVEASHFDEQMVIDAFRANLSVAPTKIASTVDGVGVFTGASAQAFSYQDHLSRKVSSLTAGGEYRLSPNSRLSARAAMEDSVHLETIHSGANFTFANLSGSYETGLFNPTVSVTPAPGLSDASKWLANPSSASVVTHLPQQDHIYNARLDYDLNDFPSSRGLGFAAGVNLRRLKREFNQWADNYTLPAGSTVALSSFLRASPASGFDAVAPVYIDYDQFWSYVAANGKNAVTNALSSSYALREDVLAGYAAAYLTQDRFRLIVGGRYERTSIHNRTAQLLNNAFTPFAYSRHYSSFLPNIQGSYDLSPTLRLRAAYTQTLARPNFSQFAPGQTVNNFTNQNTTAISGANPDLVARVSKNYDLALEGYFPSGYWSISAFHKDIDHEVYTLLTTTPNPAGGVTTISTPQNAGTSRVSGVETAIDWSDFTGLSPLLAGFGARANYTYLAGRLNVLSTSGVQRTIKGLNQQPRYEANLILYYDRGPYAASLTYASRGLAFNSTVGATPAGDFWVLPFRSLNARASYRLNGHLLAFVEGRNLTDTHYREVTGAARNLTTTSIRDGETVTVGVQFRY